MPKNKEPTESSPSESRRDMLQKIGLALAATAIAGNAREASAQVKRGDRVAQGSVKLSDSIQTAVTGNEGELKVFFASDKYGAASVLVIKASDQESLKLARAQLRTEPATATVVNGVVQVNLGRAASGRCNLSRAATASAARAVDFGNPPPIQMGPITR